MLSRRLVILFFILCAGYRVFAYHIIGGEMIYTRLAGNNFEITLKIYRDCSSPEAAPYDDPLQIYVYNAAGVLVDSLVLNFPGSVDLDPDLTNPCITEVPDLCVQEAIYVGYIELPPSAGGYDLVYQRCCRNTTIINIVDPVATGATYTEHIPDPGSVINSSARFNNFPPIVICGNYPFNFDHSATDPDGDLLVYEWFHPFNGASYTDPDPSPAPAPPFDVVNFYGPYSYTYPIESSPAFSINGTTGYLAGTPTAFGQYVVGIAVKEYRAGVLINTHYRDFQFNITDCEPSIVASLPAEINNCNDFTVNFENWSYGTDEFEWDFGVYGITSDVSEEENPEYVYPDTGIYIVRLIAFPGQTCSDTTYSTVSIYPQLIPDIDFDATCAKSPVQFTDASTTDFGTLTSWQWNYGDGGGSMEQNPEYTYDEPGDYMVIFTVQNSVGCVAEIYDTISIYSLPNPMFEAENACLQQVGTIYSTSVIFIGYEIVDWQWEVEPGDYFEGESFEYYFDTAGTYTVTLTATSNLGCVDSITDIIIVPEPVVAEPIADVTICEGDSVQLNAGGGIYYQWFPDENITDPALADPYVFPENNTTYSVIVSDECSSDTVQVIVNVLSAPELEVGVDTIVYSGHPVQMWATGAVNYLWEPPLGLTDAEIADPIATPPSTVQYIVTGTDKAGCASVDTALVYVIPSCFHFVDVNAFSPNGDGVNDNFRLITNGDDELVSMEIYNRWGQLIFQTDNLINGWDGTNGLGKQQEIGSYIYKIWTQCDGILQSLSGSVTLLR